MPGFRTFLPLTFITAALFAPSISMAAEDPAAQAGKLAHFERNVRPLLLQHCTKCHGLKKQEGSLRLDVASGIRKGGDSGPAIVPGKPEESLLIAAVRGTGDRQMPPDSRLKPAEIEALVRWISDGAVWPLEQEVSQTRTGQPTTEERQHWSFQPIVRPPVPEVNNPAWAATPIDRFLLAKLEQQGLQPRPQADKRTLLRRLTFDLTGLPPTPEEISAFLADNSPEAYSRVVDRLLASPHYGERWGRHWLDVARYADTAGDGADYPVPEAHLYRNWVIRAFNADMPLTDFLRQQIAGDLLAKQAMEADSLSPQEYADLVVATGYLAVGKRYGYNVNTEFQHLDIADTIESVGRSLLGLSLGCARCHDHKYEPVTSEDYYALYGIFASSTFAFPGGEEHKRPANFAPLYSPKQVEELNRSRDQHLAPLEARLKAIEQERADWAQRSQHAGGVDLAFEGQKEGAPPAAPWFTAGPNVVTAEAQSPFVHVHPKGTRGLRVGKGAPNEGIRMEFSPRTAKDSPVLHLNLDFRNTDDPENGGAYRLYVGHGAIITTAIECSVESRRFSIRNGDAWEQVRTLEPGVWYNLQFTLNMAEKTYTGRIGRKDDVVSFESKRCVPNWDGTVDVVISDNLGQKKGTVITRDFDNLGLQAPPFPPLEATEPATGPTLSTEKLRERLAELDQQVKSLQAERDMAAARFTVPVAYAVTEGKPQNVRIQRRGEPTNLGPEVSRRWISLLGGDSLPAPDSGSGRLALADWLTRPENPLTARVFVNRIWQHHFGAGLVPTTSDFGLRGDRPSHPELLDWLASELRDAASPRSIKSLHRQIVLSSAYQQTSEDDSAALTVDSQNRLLWRFPSRRLSAEEIRDAMLTLSGQLEDHMPGAHPFPPVNSWGFTIHYPFAAHYDSRHRSVYLMVQRARKHPYLSLFDGADPNLSTDVRPITTTPLQSLYLMNDPFVHSQSQGFARRLLSIEGDDRTRVVHAFEAATGMPPTESQLAESIAYLQELTSRLTSTAPPSEAAAQTAWSSFCHALLTSNGFLFVE